MFVINTEVIKLDNSKEWWDESIPESKLGLIDLLAKWSYEAEVNYDMLPIPLSSTINVMPSIGPVDGINNYGYEVYLGINENYDEAVQRWKGYTDNVPGKGFHPYYMDCSQYVQDYFNDLGVFAATHGLSPYWSDYAALGWYKNPVWQCQSESEFRQFMIEFEKLLKKRYPNNNISVRIPEGRSTGGGCYIATSVYGSYDCPEVWTLRRFRDERLLTSFLGRVFVRTYYVLSPTIVKVFGGTSWFNKIWKRRLDIMVQKLHEKGYESTPYYD